MTFCARTNGCGRMVRAHASRIPRGHRNADQPQTKTDPPAAEPLPVYPGFLDVLRVGVPPRAFRADADYAGLAPRAGWKIDPVIGHEICFDELEFLLVEPGALAHAQRIKDNQQR